MVEHRKPKSMRLFCLICSNPTKPCRLQRHTSTNIISAAARASPSLAASPVGRKQKTAIGTSACPSTKSGLIALGTIAAHVIPLIA